MGVLLTATFLLTAITTFLLTAIAPASLSARIRAIRLDTYREREFARPDERIQRRTDHTRQVVIACSMALYAIVISVIVSFSLGFAPPVWAFVAPRCIVAFVGGMAPYGWVRVAQSA